MRLLVHIELLFVTVLVLTHQSTTSDEYKVNFALIDPLAISLNQDYSIFVTIAESEKPVPFLISLRTTDSNELLLKKEILVYSNDSEVCTFKAEEIRPFIPRIVSSSNDYLALSVSPFNSSDESWMTNFVHIKETNAPLVLFQTDKTEYFTGENVNYQITIVDENYQPLNQITSLQVIRKSPQHSYFDYPSVLGEPLEINVTEQEQTFFKGSLQVNESMGSISITGNSSKMNDFQESYFIIRKELSLEGETIQNKNSLRVNMEFSRQLISLDEPNVTVTLSLMDTDDETYLNGNCVLELTDLPQPFPFQSNDRLNNTRRFQIPLNPATGEGQVTFNVSKELNITSHSDFEHTGRISILFSAFCGEPVFKRISEKINKSIEVMETSEHVTLIWNEISPRDENGMSVVSLWFGILRIDLQPVQETSFADFLSEFTPNLHLQTQVGKLIIINSTKTNVVMTQFPPGKSINAEFVVKNFTQFGSNDFGIFTRQGTRRNFNFFGNYKSYKMEMNPSFKVKLAGEGGNVERGKNASFNLQSIILPSLENNFHFTAILHSEQTVFTREKIQFTSKINSSRFEPLNETFDFYIPQNITTPNLFLTVCGLFETPGSLKVKREFFEATTNIYLSSPAILSLVNATDNTETMLTQVSFDLGGTIENITEVSWTITKLGVDKRSPIDKLKDEFDKKEPSPMSFRKSTSTDYSTAFNEEDAFPKHIHGNHRMQHRMFYHTSKIQPKETISFSKSFDRITEHGEYLISAMTVYNETSSSSSGLYFTNQIRFTVSPPPLILHMTAPESVIVGQQFQVQTTVKNPTDELYEGIVTLDYYYEEQNKTRLSEHVKLDGNSWVNIIFPIVTNDDSTLVLDFQSDISPSLTVQKLVTAKQPINEESNIPEVNNQDKDPKIVETVTALMKAELLNGEKSFLSVLIFRP